MMSDDAKKLGALLGWSILGFALGSAAGSILFEGLRAGIDATLGAILFSPVNLTLGLASTSRFLSFPLWAALVGGAVIWAASCIAYLRGRSALRFAAMAGAVFIGVPNAFVFGALMSI